MAQNILRILSMMRLIAVLLFVLILIGIVLTEKAKRQFVIMFFVIATIIVALNYLAFPETESVFQETIRTYFSTIWNCNAVLFHR